MKKPSIPFALTHQIASQVCNVAELVGSLQLQTASRQIVSPDSDVCRRTLTGLPPPSWPDLPATPI